MPFLSLSRNSIAKFGKCVHQKKNLLVDLLLDDKQYVIHFLRNLRVAWQLIFLSSTQVNLTNQILVRKVTQKKRNSGVYKREFF